MTPQLGPVPSPERPGVLKPSSLTSGNFQAPDLGGVHPRGDGAGKIPNPEAGLSRCALEDLQKSLPEDSPRAADGGVPPGDLPHPLGHEAQLCIQHGTARVGRPTVDGGEMHRNASWRNARTVSSYCKKPAFSNSSRMAAISRSLRAMKGSRGKASHTPRILKRAYTATTVDLAKYMMSRSSFTLA